MKTKNRWVPGASVNVDGDLKWCLLHGGEKIYTCQNCGAEFTVSRKNSGKPHRYCSRWCVQKSRSKAGWGFRQYRTEEEWRIYRALQWKEAMS
jgi:DNA-directed RNA polymerase subunit RPC12/RpoP